MKTIFFIILIALIAIYAFECTCWAPESAFAFRLSRAGLVTPANPVFRVGSLGVNLFLNNPIPGFGDILFCENTPPCASPCCICNCAFKPHSEHTQSARFHDVPELKVRGTEIFSGSISVSLAATELGAIYFRDFIESLRNAPVQERASLIQKEFSRLLNTKAAKNRFRHFKYFYDIIVWDSRLLLIGLFVALVTVWLLGLIPALPLIATLLVLIVRQIIVFARVHDAFYKNAVSTKWHRISSLVLSPVSTIRIGVLLLRNVLAHFHSITVCHSLSSDETSRQFASSALRRLAFAADFERADPACEAATWAFPEWQSSVQRWAEEQFGELRGLLSVPNRKSLYAVAYCPRCLQEYVPGSRGCSECPGVALQPFGEAGTPQNDAVLTRK